LQAQNSHPSLLDMLNRACFSFHLNEKPTFSSINQLPKNIVSDEQELSFDPPELDSESLVQLENIYHDERSPKSLDLIPNAQGKNLERQALDLIAQQWDVQVLSPSQKQSLYDRQFHNRAKTHHSFRDNGKSLEVFGELVLTNSSVFNLNALTEIHFSYCDYNFITNQFSTLKKYCHHLKSLKFTHNYIHCLYQIDSLALLNQLQHIHFGDNPECNPILSCDIHRDYCMFRFANLKTLHGDIVKEKDKLKAKKLFSGLKRQWKNADVLRIKGWCLPDLTFSQNAELVDEVLGLIWKQEGVAEIGRKRAEEKVNLLLKESKRVLEVQRKIREVWDEVLEKFVEGSIHDFQNL